MPTVQIPPFGYITNNDTTVTFVDMVSNLGSGILVIPLISLMEDIAICKAFGKITLLYYKLQINIIELYPLNFQCCLFF